MTKSLLQRAVLPLFTLLVAVALGAPPTASAATIGAGSSTARRKDPDKDTKKDSGKKDAGQGNGKGEAAKEPPFDKAIEGARVVKGLFTLYIKDDEAKYLLEILPEQFDTPFLLNPTLVSGLGQAFVYPADSLPEYVVVFERSGKTVRLLHRNVLFRAQSGSSLDGAASLAAPDAIVGQGRIESQPHPERNSVLVDLGAIALGDLEGLGLYLKKMMEAPYQFDKDGSSLVSLQAYPANIDFETVLHFRTPEVKKPLIYAADSRSLLVRFHYSLARLPDTGYRARLADDRVGHFLAMVNDYTDDRPDQPTVRYVTRWQLEKKDPSAPLSEPKQPIVYYLEKTIPEAYREAVRRGVLGWNSAFEAIGFKNALVVRDQPDDPEWNAADVRYATLRWIVAPNARFAQGPSRINPYTGQIFDADIRFSADMIRGVRGEYVEMVVPVSTPAAASRLDPGTRALIETLQGWTSMLGPMPLAGLLISGAPGRPATDSLPALGAGGRARARAGLGCDFATGATEQAAFGLNLLQARGAVDTADEDRYVDDFITHVTLHEVGHTLGLRHNFKASGMLPNQDLQDAARTREGGLTGSVMDYIPVNLARQGASQGQYWQTTIGPYDRFAIEYAYTPVEASSPEEELPRLEEIAARATRAELAYGTDEDTFAGTPRGIDPTSNMYDLGRDLLAYHAGRVDLADELLGRMESHFSEPGARYQKLLLVFNQAIGELIPAAVNVPKTIGGIRHHRDHIGDPDGRVPYEPVPASEQRAALDFLTRRILGPGAFRVPPQLLNKLAVERMPDIEGRIWEMTRNDLPIHSIALAVQSLPLQRLYHPITLARLNDLEARYPSPDQAFTMAEMFTGLRTAVWGELDRGTAITSFRRNLQRHHLQTLIGIAVQLDQPYPEDARTLARADLIALRRAVDALLGAPGRPAPPAAARLDRMTRAHLDETRARIDAALEAALQRRLPQASPAGGHSG